MSFRTVRLSFFFILSNAITSVPERMRDSYHSEPELRGFNFGPPAASGLVRITR